MYERIYVDFNSRTHEGNILVSPQEEIPFANGNTVILYDEELEVTAKLNYEEDYKHWTGTPDWATIRYFSN